MIRTLAAVAGLSLVGFALADGAAAQTWGQPVYVSPYGHFVGGTPLSEVETRPYVTTGRWADGYSDQAYVYVPAPIHGARFGHHDRYGHGHSGYGHGRHEPRPRPGYRDSWGYDDDRPPAARRRSHDRRDHDCGCGDAYLYDR